MIIACSALDLEHLKLEQFVFCWLALPVVASETFRNMYDMPHVSSLPRTTPQRKNTNSQLFNALGFGDA